MDCHHQRQEKDGDHCRIFSRVILLFRLLCFVRYALVVGGRPKVVAACLSLSPSSVSVWVSLILLLLTSNPAPVCPASYLLHGYYVYWSCSVYSATATPIDTTPNENTAHPRCSVEVCYCWIL